MKKLMIILVLVFTLTLNVFGNAKGYDPETLPQISMDAVSDDAVILEHSDEYIIVESDDEIYIIFCE